MGGDVQSPVISGQEAVGGRQWIVVSSPFGRLFGGHSVVIQWSFNSHSMVIQLFYGMLFVRCEDEVSGIDGLYS